MTVQVEVVDSAAYQDYVETLGDDLREAQEIVKEESAIAQSAAGGEEEGAP
jgi:hypothetical protein